jgi:hypothetical protein
MEETKEFKELFKEREDISKQLFNHIKSSNYFDQFGSTAKRKGWKPIILKGTEEKFPIIKVLFSWEGIPESFSNNYYYKETQEYGRNFILFQFNEEWNDWYKPFLNKNELVYEIINPSLMELESSNFNTLPSKLSGKIKINKSIIDNIFKLYLDELNLLIKKTGN